MALNLKHLRLSCVVSLQETSFAAVASRGDNVVNKMQKMANMGFDGVELAVRDPLEIDIPELKRGLGVSGLKVPAIGTGQSYIEEGLSLCHPHKDIRNAAIQRIRHHIGMASSLDAMVIIGLVRGNFSKSIPREDSINILRESLATCLDYSEKKGVFLVLEPLNRYECNFINSIHEGAAFIKEMDHPQLKLLADTFHMNIEDRNFRESLKFAAPYLVHIHFADSNRHFPGQGHIGFADIFAVLKEIGYSGFISGEMLPEPTEEDAMKGFLNFMRKYVGREML